MAVTPGWGGPFSPASQTSCTKSVIGSWRAAAAADASASSRTNVSQARMSVEVNDPSLYGDGHGLAAAGHLELAEDALDVHACRLGGDAERGRDRFRAVSAREQRQHLELF